MVNENLLQQIVGNTQLKSIINLVVSGKKNPIIATYKI